MNSAFFFFNLPFSLCAKITQRISKEMLTQKFLPLVNINRTGRFARTATWPSTKPPSCTPRFTTGRYGGSAPSWGGSRPAPGRGGGSPPAGTLTTRAPRRGGRSARRRPCWPAGARSSGRSSSTYSGRAGERGWRSGGCSEVESARSGLPWYALVHAYIYEVAWFCLLVAHYCFCLGGIANYIQGWRIRGDGCPVV